MVKNLKRIGTASGTLLSFVLIFNGVFFDVLSTLTEIPEATWNHITFVTKDAQILGISIIGALYVPYKNIHVKTILFLFTIWKTAVLIINTMCFDKQFSIYTIYALDLFYITWSVRAIYMKRITGRTPIGSEAFYVLLPISTIMGLLQAIFLPWHPARYETRMISDGTHLWSIRHGIYEKNLIDCTDIDKVSHVKVSLNNKLTDYEIAKLDSLVGQKATAGIKDCRKLMVAGKI
jgi:hypothetical protein